MHPCSPPRFAAKRTGSVSNCDRAPSSPAPSRCASASPTGASSLAARSLKEPSALDDVLVAGAMDLLSRLWNGERLVRGVSLSCAGLMAGERDASLFPLSASRPAQAECASAPTAGTWIVNVDPTFGSVSTAMRP